MRRILSKGIFFFSAVLFLCGGISFGEENSAVTLNPSGFVALKEGQVVRGEPAVLHSESSSDHCWVQEMFTGFNVQAKFNDVPVTGNLGLEVKIGNDYQVYVKDLGKSRRLNFYPYIARADAAYSWGDEENPSMVLELGYFPFKYDNDVKNLGEYLFRSGAYPQYLTTDFDFPMTRLLGLRLSGHLYEKIKWDLLATTNIEWTAIGDLNVSGLISWKPVPLLEMGLGGSWCSILSVNWDNTTPMVTGNDYIYDGKRYFYTFAGQKLMGRLTLDPQSLFPNEVFGKDDFKVYSEAAVLGVINYPVSVDGFTRYDDIKQRIPVMGGFNFPVCKFLDVLSLEVEWFGNPYPNDLNPIVFDNQPTPLSSFQGTKSAVYLDNHDDDLKWSVYGRKTFATHFNVTFQFARDHLRWFRYDYTAMDGMEALRKNQDWYWTCKVGYIF